MKFTLFHNISSTFIINYSPIFLYMILAPLRIYFFHLILKVHTLTKTEKKKKVKIFLGNIA